MEAFDPQQVHFVARDSTFAKGSEEYIDIDGADAEEAENAVVTEKEMGDKLESLEKAIVRNENLKFNEVNNKISSLESKIDALVKVMSTASMNQTPKKGLFGRK